MKFRCINAFAFDDKVYPGGLEVDGDDPIMRSHRAHFAQVEQASSPVVSEVATAAPGEPRSLTAPKRGPGRRKPADEEPAEAATAEPESTDKNEG